MSVLEFQHLYHFMRYKKTVILTLKRQYFWRCPFFTARRFASAVYAMVLCLSVCPTVPSSVRHKLVFYQNDNAALDSPMSLVSDSVPQPFLALFPGPPGKPVPERTSGLYMVQGKINRGRHTDHPAGRHSIRTKQCLPPPSPIFTGRMPFLSPNQQCQSTEPTKPYSTSIDLVKIPIRSLPSAASNSRWVGKICKYFRDVQTYVYLLINSYRIFSVYCSLLMLLKPV